MEAPTKEAIQKAHDEAHGAVPNEIIQVDPTVVEAFLGRVKDPPPTDNTTPTGNYVPRDAALRVIMFTDLKDSTAMTTRLGEAKALHLLHIHNAFTRNALREHSGREVKHLGDGIMASFASIVQALDCAISIQKTLASFNCENAETPLHLRIGLSAGEPVEDDNDLFGATVQLAARLCSHAKPDQILAIKTSSSILVERYPYFPTWALLCLRVLIRPYRSMKFIGEARTKKRRAPAPLATDARARGR